ncbi:uracil-DNA glycosylase [Croceibacterium mercuriale]|uniref:Uracil-DNA glycosylase n=1 Tax=Croceibacterium mercuriale TaxID=1572751 RepID=A0A0B2BY37_9SPHN|nr:uracil-DNA glycosylase [Croceibacterium mercuriale]KHL24927.1 uracil-DNA glycosylase [Croceibacterium mercuriale]
MDEFIPDDWRVALAPALADPRLHDLDRWLQAEEAGGKAVYPPRGSRLRALALTPLADVRVVILGQDPYHGPGQAHGLAFSVPEGVRLPPSLRNIYRELAEDCPVAPRTSGDLESWARQGVLLLNTTLTVEAAQAGSHAGRGWELLTDAIVRAVAQGAGPTVFILWGNHAQGKVARIAELGTGTHHLLITSAHPSPLSARRGFFGSRPFSRANTFLAEHGRGTIAW